MVPLLELVMVRDSKRLERTVDNHFCSFSHVCGLGKLVNRKIVFVSNTQVL